MSQKPKSSLAWILLFLISTIWGSSFILIKKGLIIFSAFEVGTLRIFLASLVLMPMGIRAISSIPRNKLWYVFLVGSVGSFIPAVLFAIAQTQLESSVTGVFNSFVPIFVIITGTVFFGLKIKTANLIGILIGFLGCIMIILGGADFSLNGINYYVLFILAATVMYGLNVNIIKSKVSNIKPIDLTAVSFLLVAPFAFCFLFFGTDFTYKVELKEGFLMALFYISILGVVGTALAMYLFNNLVKISTPVFASSCTYFIPLVAICWGVIDGEQLNIYQYLGVGIVLSGVYLANKK